MAIQVRRGNESDFDASKMLPGEWAVSLDTRYVRMCFAPGIVLRMSTYDAFEADMAQIQAILAECRNIQSAVQRIQTEVNTKASLTVEYANDAKESADRAYSEAERAKTYADNAEAVTNVQIATKDRAGLIKGGNNHIAEDGTLMLITTTSLTTQPNSYAGRENILEIGGVTEQDSTTGKNLMPINDTTFIGTKEIILEEPIPAGTYTMSAKIVSNDINSNLCRVLFYSGSTELGDLFLARGSRVSGEITTRSEITSVLLYASDSFAGSDGDTVTWSNIQIEAGSTMTEYEPYTGGIPAPNPSYPMEIKNSKVKGIRTHGKNLLNVSTFVNGSINASGEHAPNMTNMISDYIESNGEVYVTTNANVAGIGIAFYDANKNYLKRVVKINTNHSTSQKVDGCEYVRAWFGIDVQNLNAEILASYEPMLNEGTTALPYEPYTESSYAFSQPIELYGMNGVQDVIIPKEVGGKWTKRRITSNIKMETNSGWNNAKAVVLVDFFIGGISVDGYATTANILCTHAKASAPSLIANGDVENCVGQSGIALYLTMDNYSTIDELKTFLDENEVYVYYQLATPTTEALPIADQIGLNSLTTYDGITYVEFIYDELEPTFKGKYGTSEVGGYTLESLLTARNNELRLTAVENAVVNNI